MDRGYWGLSGPPFRVADGRGIYTSPGGEEALARLLFLVEEERRLGILLGQSGGGKTTLLAQLAGHLRRQGAAVALISLPGLWADELVWQTAALLGANPDIDDPPFRLWRRLTDRLAELRYQQIATALLFDDADQAAQETLAAVVRMAAFAPGTSSPLTIVVAADVKSQRQLDPRLVSMADLRVELPAWDEHDTADYVVQALAAAGADREIFAADAVARLHEITGGIPRRINQLADLALLAGAAKEAEFIDAATVEAAADELGLALTSTSFGRASGN